uniref:CTP synthase n=1 Tax=Aceria tosichella TaxID=561515 RepID=A0A6G1S3V0_9ACAR
MKYILIAGGVISGIGKGVVTSSIGALLKSCNLKVTAIKIDPYLNIDAGTFSPTEHGEVFVLNDGCEVDLDLGNYERYLDTDLCQANNITTGKIYQQVIDRERRGDYLGKTVQIIPHVTDAIEQWILKTANMQRNGQVADVCLIELGGTLGDIEGMPYHKALCQLKRTAGPDNFCCCLVTPLVQMGHDSDLKSKPTQQSVEKLLSQGIGPDLIVCRSMVPMTQAIKDKIYDTCPVRKEDIFNLLNLDTIYRVPIELEKQGMVSAISEHLKVKLNCDTLSKWNHISDIAVNAELGITIALVGKYTSSNDCYTSVIKALEHACYDLGAKPTIRMIDSQALEENDAQAWMDLKTAQCLLVPGGFGIRGTQGKIQAINWARRNGMPFLGICLGFQLAVVEYAREVLNIENAHSAEFESDLAGACYEPLVIEMLEYKDPENKMGGTMRLGLRQTYFVTEDSILREKYGGDSIIQERHRHRYEINPDYIDRLERAGLRFVGKNDDLTRMEILELEKNLHPYFVGVQFHPEYLSRPFKPSPPFRGLIEAGLKRSRQTNGYSKH